MNVRRAFSMLVLAVGLAVTGFAQETPRPRDDSIDSLLEKLSDPSDGAGKKDDKAASSKKGSRDAAKSADAVRSRPGRPEAAGSKSDKAVTKKPDGATPLSGQDQEVDDLLEKLGETVETPAPDDRRRGGGGGGEKTDARGPSQRPDQAERNRLSGKDKETDEHLEELTGRKRRKRQDDNEERSGAAGEIIKQMRDIEQKLTRPDTGETTREEQKKVVKQIETLIEEARQSGQSSMRRMVMRQRRQQGRQPGQQPGSTEGAMAGGAPKSKPLKPPSKHSTASGKDIWGHLPPEMRTEIENMINELPLASKEELIDRYYLSVGKGKPVREETP